MNKINNPIFLIGSERSGTTLLRLLLDHHPDIAFNLESEFLVSKIDAQGRFPDVTEYIEWLKHDRVFKHSKFNISSRMNYEELVNDFLYQKKTRDGKNLVGATVHFNFSKLPLIWPEARYIYLYRDGRDVASSVVQMGWAGNVYIAADWWIEAENEWNGMQELLHDSQYVQVSYETLMEHPKEEMTRICEFLSIPYSERVYDYIHDSTYTLPDPKFTFQWKRKMSAKNICLIEAKIREMLLKRDYELSCDPRLQLNIIHRKLLSIDSRFRVFFTKIKTYGFILTVSEIISRRLRLSGWHQKMLIRIDEIIDENIR